MCRVTLTLPLDGDDPLLTVVVTEPGGETVAGHLCSTDCLIDYAAEVRRREMEDLV